MGVRLEQARELLKARNLLISIAEERDDPNRPAGSIVSQNPLAGSESQPGTTVQVAVARAVSSVIVPPLAGLKPDEAARLLAGKGLQLGPQKAAASESVAAGLVAGSEPAAGSPVPPAGVVSLLIATPAGKAVPKVTGKRVDPGQEAAGRGRLQGRQDHLPLRPLLRGVHHPATDARGGRGRRPWRHCRPDRERARLGAQ